MCFVILNNTIFRANTKEDSIPFDTIKLELASALAHNFELLFLKAPVEEIWVDGQKQALSKLFLQALSGYTQLIASQELQFAAIEENDDEKKNDSDTKEPAASSCYFWYFVRKDFDGCDLDLLKIVAESSVKDKVAARGAWLESSSETCTFPLAFDYDRDYKKYTRQTDRQTDR